jgi:hypothetical protein
MKSCLHCHHTYGFPCYLGNDAEELDDDCITIHMTMRFDFTEKQSLFFVMCSAYHHHTS